MFHSATRRAVLTCLTWTLANLKVQEISMNHQEPDAQMLFIHTFSCTRVCLCEMQMQKEDARTFEPLWVNSFSCIQSFIHPGPGFVHSLRKGCLNSLQPQNQSYYSYETLNAFLRWCNCFFNSKGTLTEHVFTEASAQFCNVKGDWLCFPLYLSL